MSVRLKLIVIVVFVALVPLAVSAFTALRIHRSAYDEAVVELQRNTARYAAATADTWLEHTTRSLRAVATRLPWYALNEEERRGALSIVYGQLDHIVMVQLIDGEGGGIGNSTFAVLGEPNTPEHRGITFDALAKFAEHLPRRPGVERDVVVSEAFAEPSTGVPLVAITIPLRMDGGTWSLVVGVSLVPLCAGLSSSADSVVRISLWDSQRRRVCPVGAGGLRAAPPSLADALSGGAGERFSYRSAGGELMVASGWQSQSGWIAVAYQPASYATVSSRQMSRQTVLWIAMSVAIALIAGMFLSRAITQSVRALEEGARALGRGELDHRIRVDGHDELSVLAETFNQMSEGLQRRDDEIRTWNRELQERVDARTRELREAQEQLLQSRKISAMSALAAGVAHEINNPLTAVLGMAQVLRRRGERSGADPSTARMLTGIEDGAKRIRDIVGILQTLSQENEGEGFAPVAVNEVVRHAVEAKQDRADEHEVQLETGLSEAVLSVRGNVGQLRQVVQHLIDNALTATGPGGNIAVSTEDVGGELIKIIVRDDGSGIAPEHLDRVFEPFFTTKQDWQGRGLGLTVAHQIIEAHNGVIKLDSELDEGTTVTITLPIARAGSHLK